MGPALNTYPINAPQAHAEDGKHPLTDTGCINKNYLTHTEFTGNSSNEDIKKNNMKHAKRLNKKWLNPGKVLCGDNIQMVSEMKKRVE